jgi:ribosomal protein L7/L12
MEDLIKFVTEKTGLSADQAKSAVEAVGSFLKDKMPGGMGEQVNNFLGGKEIGGLAGTAAGIKDKLGL